LSKLSFAFNIFVLIPVQEMVYLKVIQKNHPNGRFCVGNHRSKNVSEKFRGGFSLLSPPPWIRLCLVPRLNLSVKQQVSLEKLRFSKNVIKQNKPHVCNGIFLRRRGCFCLDSKTC